MSKWIDKDVMSIIEEKIETIELTRRTLTEAEINEIMPEVVKHFKKNKENDEVFSDETASYLLIQMPILAEQPKEIKSAGSKKGDPIWRLFCKCKLGFVGVFGSKSQWKEIGMGEYAWTRGKLTKQYDLMKTERKFYKTLEDCLAKNGIDEEDLNEDDLLTSYTYNLWQVIK
ncbi:MAG: hypothetical protein OEL89_00515 [Candidatus Peregrinibacteria bacterium]|nr:hypothetical protein [Candidatus Peregrinibacteria bacterium]